MSVVLATAGYDHKIRFWEAPSGVCVRMIKFADSQVNRLEITPDKQFIAASGNPAIRLYEIEHQPTSGTGTSSQQQPQEPQQAVLTLEGHTNNVTAIGFQRDGRYLYSCSEDGTIKVWDLRNPNYSRSFNVGAPVNSVCLRADRDEFISGDQNGFVKVFDLGGSGCINAVKPAASYSSSGCSSSSMSMRVADRQIDFPNNRSKTPELHPIDKKIRSNSAASYAYGGGKSRSSSRRSWAEGTVPIQAVDISEDSRTLVAVSNHGTVFVWDPSSNKPSSLLVQDEPTTPTGVDEKHGGGGVTDSWLRPITKFRAHAEKPGTYCLHAKIAPDCRHLVTTASDGTAKLFDTTTWELTQTLVDPIENNSTNDNDAISSTTPWVWDAAFCADSSYLVTASSDHVARLWSLRTGDTVRQYHGHQSAITCVALNDSAV